MKTDKFEIIDTNITDISKAVKGKDIYYQCTICNGIVPSQPNDNLGCECGNVFIDIDYFRLAVDDLKNFQVIRMTRARE